jgi:hypothetical protein
MEAAAANHKRARGDDDDDDDDETSFRTNTTQQHPWHRGQPEDTLYINLAGDCVMPVSRRTLTVCRGSLLATMFSGRWDDRLAKDCDGNFYLDHPAEIFRPLVGLLRSKAIERPGYEKAPLTKKAFANNNDLYAEFLRTVEYYGLMDYLYAYQIHQTYGPEVLDNGKEVIPSFYDADVRFTTTERRTFFLEAFLHTRRVESFEIILEENVGFLQVGWVDAKELVDVSKRTQVQTNLTDTWKSIVLDVGGGTSKNYEYEEDVTLDESALNLTAGTRIRCSLDDFEYQVNQGKPCVHPVPDGYTVIDLRVPTNFVPAITVKGSFRLVKLNPLALAAFL